MSNISRTRADRLRQVSGSSTVNPNNKRLRNTESKVNEVSKRLCPSSSSSSVNPQQVKVESYNGSGVLASAFTSTDPGIRCLTDIERAAMNNVACLYPEFAPHFAEILLKNKPKTVDVCFYNPLKRNFCKVQQVVQPLPPAAIEGPRRPARLYWGSGSEGTLPLEYFIAKSLDEVRLEFAQILKTFVLRVGLYQGVRFSNCSYKGLLEDFWQTYCCQDINRRSWIIRFPKLVDYAKEIPDFISKKTSELTLYAESKVDPLFKNHIPLILNFNFNLEDFNRTRMEDREVYVRSFVEAFTIFSYFETTLPDPLIPSSKEAQQLKVLIQAVKDRSLNYNLSRENLRLDSKGNVIIYSLYPDQDENKGIDARIYEWLESYTLDRSAQKLIYEFIYPGKSEKK